MNEILRFPNRSDTMSKKNGFIGESRPEGRGIICEGLHSISKLGSELLPDPKGSGFLLDEKKSIPTKIHEISKSFFSNHRTLSDVACHLDHLSVGCLLAYDVYCLFSGKSNRFRIPELTVKTFLVEVAFAVAIIGISESARNLRSSLNKKLVHC